MVTRALVLSGGGVAGIAWELGVLLGLRDGGVDVTDADLLIGTSAGSTVAAQLGSGVDLQQLYDRQLDPRSPEIPVELDLEQMVADWGSLMSGAQGPADARAKIAAAADVEHVSPAARRAVIEQRLPSHEWPQRQLLITAVDTSDGSLKVFDSSSGVELVDAVAASCAVPFVWPAVTIGGARYVDGGIYSTSNVSLADGYDRILVLSPAPRNGPGLLSANLDTEIAGMSSAVHVIDGDAEALAAFGTNPLNAATRKPSALAGHRQGLAAAANVAAYWA